MDFAGPREPRLWWTYPDRFRGFRRGLSRTTWWTCPDHEKLKKVDSAGLLILMECRANS